ncbi:MAG TPA: isocitrate lyase/phosphoenolpyruvate mutase family protein [Spirochaetia bacterium]|nr:isocitrate lyase/phosphoenolpyruvate mutase family protein [Spirochaetia bacterium]
MSPAPAQFRPRPGEKEIADRRAEFRRLHESGCFVIPNPWDAGSALYLQHMGFKALATTSAGFALSRGLPDYGAVTAEMALENILDIIFAVVLPVNADFQAGFSSTPEGVAENVLRCIDTGVAGLSIEDSTGDPKKPLYDIPVAVERLKAARSAIDSSRTGVLLTARAECHLVGHPHPFEESILRLQAYAEAGADVLFAPGLKSREAIKAVVDAVSPKPVNVLMSSNVGLTVSDLASLGVRRISVGSALARAAWTGFIRAATAIASSGVFSGFDGTVPLVDLDRFMKSIEDHHARTRK